MKFTAVLSLSRLRTIRGRDSIYWRSTHRLRRTRSASRSVRHAVRRFTDLNVLRVGPISPRLFLAGDQGFPAA